MSLCMGIEWVAVSIFSVQPTSLPRNINIPIGFKIRLYIALVLHYFQTFYLHCLIKKTNTCGKSLNNTPNSQYITPAALLIFIKYYKIHHAISLNYHTDFHKAKGIYMKNSAHFCLAVLTLSAAVGAQAARPVEFTVGTEYYNETYRENKDGERLMQQKGNLWSLNAGVKYRFNERHAAKLEGRYSRGKSDYTGRFQDGSGATTDYGSATLKGAPRRAYDIRALYEYTHPLNERFSISAGAGLGHRVLKDLSRRVDPDDYDRKNQTTYAQINAGVNIALPTNFEISPRIAYNRAVKGRQYSYEANGNQIEMKQSGGYGFEIEVPVSKKFSNGSKISLAPFYRNWRVNESDAAYVVDDDAIYSTVEPKNRTQEMGVRLQYSF